VAVENDAVAALLSLLSKRDRGWCISSPVRAFDIASVAHGANRRRRERETSFIHYVTVVHKDLTRVVCPYTLRIKCLFAGKNARDASRGAASVLKRATCITARSLSRAFASTRDRRSVI
jgi:hypothetical protein